MVYSRCIGTRYCANNCPYTVRVFNFHSGDWPTPLDRQLNPDVSPRPAGVMEKCTFCVQRIQDAQDHAKDEEREVNDGEIQPACAQSCPAEAIVFGDLENPSSRVARRARSNRAYHLLEDLDTQPSVIYLKEAIGVETTPERRDNAPTPRQHRHEEAIFRPVIGLRPGLVAGSLVTGALVGLFLYCWGYQVRNDFGVAGINRRCSGASTSPTSFSGSASAMLAR